MKEITINYGKTKIATLAPKDIRVIFKGIETARHVNVDFEFNSNVTRRNLKKIYDLLVHNKPFHSNK